MQISFVRFDMHWKQFYDNLFVKFGISNATTKYYFRALLYPLQMQAK